MMQFKKARLGLAMAIALTGGMSMVNTASAAYISEDGLGQALIFPYYTVRDGHKSLFNITNTSGNTVAVKVRFRESHNSRDVLDFNLVLSPYDVWTGWLEDSATGPVLKSEDKSCTSPMMTSAGFAANNYGYAGSFADSTNTTIDRAREGYVEVITMGYTDDDPAATVFSNGANVPVNSLAYNAKHVSGTPRGCATVDKAFLAGSASSTSTAKSFATAAVPSDFTAGTTNLTYGNMRSGDPLARTLLNGGALPLGNPLKGNFTLLKDGSGIAGGTAAVAIADFYAYGLDPRAPAGPDGIPGNADDTPQQGALPFGTVNGLNLVTAQQAPYYLEPTLVSASTTNAAGVPGVSTTATAGTGGLWVANDAVVALLQRAQMINEWANNAKTGAATSWVVTMPMKNFYVDLPHKGTTSDPLNPNVVTNNNFQAAMNSARAYTMPTASTGGSAVVISNVMTTTGLNPISAFSNMFNSKSDVTLTYSMYDREEGSVSVNSTTVSPQPAGSAEALKYEVNVLTFDGINQLSSAVSSNVSVPTGLSTPNGWASAGLGDTNGIPAIGFMWKTRDFGTPGINYGQIIDHGYK